MERDSGHKPLPSVDSKGYPVDKTLPLSGIKKVYPMDNGQVEELAKRLGISVQQLDYWVMMGVISPSLYNMESRARRGFSSQDMEALRLLKEFVPGVK